MPTAKKSNMPDLPTAKTYKDGIGAERCLTCKAQLLDPSGAPTVPILLSDVEEIACILHEFRHSPDMWAAMIVRLEQAAGRTVKQIFAAGPTTLIHDPLCSEGIQAGDQSMPCDCDPIEVLDR